MNKKFTSRKIRDCNFEGVKFIEQDAPTKTIEVIIIRSMIIQ